MSFVKTGKYNDAQKREMRLSICRQCIFTSCNGNAMNTCNIETTICTKNNQSLIPLTENLANDCPINAWSETNKTLDGYVPDPGCGCRR